MSNLIKAARLIVTQPKTIEYLKLNTVTNEEIDNTLITSEESNHINEKEKDLKQENTLENQEDEELAQFFQCVTNNDEIIGVQSVTKQVEKILQETEVIVEQNIKKAKLEAEEIIQAAQQDADKMIIEAQEKLTSAEEQINIWQQEANDRGFKNGYAEGKKQIEYEYQAIIQDAQNQFIEAKEERIKIINGAEKEIIQLAIAVSEKIIHHELNENTQYVLDIVKAAMNKVNDREELTLKVNPENLDFVIANQEEIKSFTKGVNKMKMQSDNTIKQGGCVIETPIGTIDGRIERQVSEIKQAMMEVIESA